MTEGLSSQIDRSKERLTVMAHITIRKNMTNNTFTPSLRTLIANIGKLIGLGGRLFDLLIILKNEAKLIMKYCRIKTDNTYMSRKYLGILTFVQSAMKRGKNLYFD